ncbi:hypothetical protein GCM10023075_60150 [Streptosporangium album]
MVEALRGLPRPGGGLTLRLRGIVLSYTYGSPIVADVTAGYPRYRARAIASAEGWK